jgi:hypothetical protein
MFATTVFAAARPNSQKGIYFAQCLTGGTAGCLDAFDITGDGDSDITDGTPNRYDLIDGDAAIYVVISGTTITTYVYGYDADGTQTESSPDVIRPDDYSTQGNWILSSKDTAVNVLDSDGDGVLSDETPQFTGMEVGHATDTTLSRNAAGELAVEGVKVLDAGDTIQLAQIVIDNFADEMDNDGIWTTDAAYTVTEIGVRCHGTCTTSATIGVEDGAGTAMTITGTNPVVQTSDSSVVAYSAVTANNTLVKGELVRVTVDTGTPPAPETDRYFVILLGTRTY